MTILRFSYLVQILQCWEVRFISSGAGVVEVEREFSRFAVVCLICRKTANVIISRGYFAEEARNSSTVLKGVPHVRRAYLSNWANQIFYLWRCLCR